MGQDDELRRLERAAAAGDQEAVGRLEAARHRAGLVRKHTGVWSRHDDDCRCIDGGIPYCNRDGWVWSCCGACKQQSECSAPNMHPTYWNHPKFSQTHVSYDERLRPEYLPDEELRRLAPEAFA
jgi:hypothetical protein